MGSTPNLIAMLVFTGVVLAGFAVLKAKIATKAATDDSANANFKTKTLMTPNELEFLGRLESAAPEYRFCPQVAMGALLDPTAARKDGKAYMRARGMFAQKIVDFVAQDRKTGAVIAIIELDDRTHNGEKDGKRDAMLASAGYRIIRWNSKAKPDIATIRSELISVLPPVHARTAQTVKISV